MISETLDEFTSSYIKAALWSSTDDQDEPLDRNYGPYDLAPETLAEAIADCRDFQASFGDLITSNPARAGHDFWLTRNGHGAGFWDGDWDYMVNIENETNNSSVNVGSYLTSMSKPYGEVNLYVGDDGLIHS